MKKLGFGLMRLPLLDPNNDASIDMDQLKKMVDIFIERGFTYFDTAIMYNGFASQRAAKEALVDRYPRDSFTLATKLHSGFFDSFEDRDRVFNEQLEQTGAGYFDYYLIHGVEAANYLKYEKYDCFNWLLEKKAKGLVKHAGFSFHDTPELLDQILTKYPDMEFVQMQLNYLDWESEWVQSRAVHEVAVKHGKPVIVMEPVKGGALAKLPEPAEARMKAAHPDWSIASWALRFAAGLDGVMVVLSGMSTLEQLRENVSFMDGVRPLSKEDLETVFFAADCLRAEPFIPCTGCSYCTDGCPANIPIPEYFSIYNAERKAEDGKARDALHGKYAEAAKGYGDARDCVEY